jgi:Flp pilus assembly protein TadG
MHAQAQPVSGTRDDERVRASASSAEPAPMRRRVLSERGQSAVEFAMVVPFICLLVLALVDFGKGVNYWLDANHLASEGARLAAVLGDQPQPGGDLKQWIQQQAETNELRNGSGSVTSPAQVCISFPDGRGIGKPVTVTVTASYQWIPFSGGGTFDITGSSTMRQEQLPTYADGCT